MLAPKILENLSLLDLNWMTLQGLDQVCPLSIPCSELVGFGHQVLIHVCDLPVQTRVFTL